MRKQHIGPIEASQEMEQKMFARIETFEYPHLPAPELPVLEALGIASSRGNPREQSSDPDMAQDPHAGCEQKLAEEKQRSFDAGRKCGIEEGARAELEAHHAAREAQNGQHRNQIAAALAHIDQERENYMHAVEGEVVELALAIAARILRREAQMDPLLLTGAVRVALGQLARSTEARLKVPEAEAGLWSETIAHLPNLAVKPTVVPVPGMRPGECELETGLGSVDLGLKAQLDEIERGFFDCVGRPRPKETETTCTRANAAMEHLA